MSGTPRVLDFTPSGRHDANEHLEWVFSGTRGYVCIGILDRDGDSIPRQHFFMWPDQKDEISEFVARAIDRPWIEVLYCPYPLTTKNRSKGNTTSRRLVHVDIDKPLSVVSRAFLNKHGFRLVASGTPGRYHAYARFSRSLSGGEHRGLLEALRRYVEGDAKIADNDFLKFPGSQNYKNHPGVKLEKRNDQAYPVTVETQGRRADADYLIEELGAVTVDVTTNVDQEEWTLVKYVLGKLPAKVQPYYDMESKGEDTGRYKQCNAAVLACAEVGMSRDLIHTYLVDFEPGVEKWGKDRWHSEIDRILSKREAREQVRVGTDLQAFDVDEHFWSKRPVLVSIYQTAKAAYAGPWSTLGVAMLRTLNQVSPKVRLPDLGGGIESLNMYVLLVAASGGGKGTSVRAGRAALDVGLENAYPPLGSGEGMSKTYVRRNAKGDIEWKTNHALFNAGEVSTFLALVMRRDGTALGQLLAGFAGETLGFSNSDDSKTLPVYQDTYRMGLMAEAQMAKCGPLLREGASGLPQRFLMLPMTNPLQPRVRPDGGDPYVWTWEGALGGPGGIVRMTACSVAHDEVEERNLRRVMGILKEHPLDSHWPVVKLKVAAVFALWEGRTHINEEDWELAEAVMTVHRVTRREVQAALRIQGIRDSRARGRAAGEQKTEENRTVARLMVDRAEVILMNKMTKARGTWFTHSDLNRASGRARGGFAEACARLRKRDDVEVRTTAGGVTEYRVK